MKVREQQKPKKSASKYIKRAWARDGKPDTLKVYARKLTDPDDVIQVKNWFHNKKANFSKPPLGLGSTRKKKNKQGQPKKTS